MSPEQHSGNRRRNHHRRVRVKDNSGGSRPRDKVIYIVVALVLGLAAGIAILKFFAN